MIVEYTSTHRMFGTEEPVPRGTCMDEFTPLPIIPPPTITSFL
jgi:hypothetical protein